MQDDPSAERLLGAIADTLERRVLDQLDGSARHQVRVVINLCRILEREQRLDPGLDAEARSLISDLLHKEFESAQLAWLDLARQIDNVASVTAGSAGSADQGATTEMAGEAPINVTTGHAGGRLVDRAFLVAAHGIAMKVVRGKLAVANPGYESSTDSATSAQEPGAES